MNTGIREELIDALEQIEHADTAAGKDRARVIWLVDQETGGRKTADLREELDRRGVTLSDERIRRARYIGRLLHALDPHGMDPPQLHGIQNETILYLIQRIHEAHQRTHEDLLAIVHECGRPGLAVRTLQTLNRQAGDDTRIRESWRRVLDDARMPDEVATSLERGIARYRRVNNLTQQQALADLAALFDHLPDTYLRVLPLLLDLDRSALDAPWRILRAARQGFQATRTEPLEPTETLHGTLELLANFPPDYWTRLHTAYHRSEGSSDT